MAGELLVTISNRPSLGFRLSASREFLAYKLMLALLIVILVLGMVIDALFNWGDRAVRRRWGLIDVHQ
jgi:NitT/TauT family transport system permease protein